MTQIPHGPMETARAAWGDEMPDWIRALAQRCEQSSQSAVARELDRSPAVVTQILKRSYPASTDRLEERVRGVLMNGTVACPALGALPAHQCQDWRAKAREFAHGNPLRREMYRACNRCPRHAQTEKEKAE